MSARDRIHRLFESGATSYPLDGYLDEYRAEVRAEAAADVHRAELPKFPAGETPENVAKVVRAVDVRLAQRGAEAPYGVLASDVLPDFYEPGYVYSYPRYADGYDWKFRCDAITTHPEDGERTALGWRHFRGEWGEYAYGEDDWDIHNCDPAGDLIATPVEEVAS